MNDKRAKLDKLGEQIEQAQFRNEGDKKDQEVNTNAMSLVSRVIVELVAGVAVGMLIGYGLDSVFNTLPLFLFICIICGFGGGMLNIYRLFVKTTEE